MQAKGAWCDMDDDTETYTMLYRKTLTKFGKTHCTCICHKSFIQPFGCSKLWHDHRNPSFATLYISKYTAHKDDVFNNE